MNQMNTSAGEIDMARAVAVIAHAGQLYGRKDYFNGHVKEVALEVMRRGGDFQSIAAAYLHDVLEDSELDRHDLRKAGFSTDVVLLVAHVTRRQNERYWDYIRRVRSVGGRAMLIKVADLNVNLRNNPKESLRERYHRALDVLAGIIE